MNDTLRACCAVSIALAAPAAGAQDRGVVTLERVEVVGSHLKRIDAEGPAPVSVYRREDITLSGATRLGDFLLALPIAGAGGFDDRGTAFNSFTGAAALSLRGLGPGATLVLLNGRRVAPYGLALDNDDTFVDLNSLPLAAVDRIEILRDGASAIYGADAIGGVVNIVLRRDFAGAETMLRAGQSSHGDAGRRYASATFGGGDLDVDRYNAFVTIDALRQDALFMSAREFSRSADQRARGGSDSRSPFSFPPTVRLPGAQPMAGPGCPPERVQGDAQGSFCVFDPNPYAVLLPQVERLGVLVFGSFAPAPALRLYGELALNRSRTDSQIAPAPVRSVVPAAALTNPFGENAAVRWRPVDAGPRRSEVVIDFQRAVVGAQSDWRDWDWDAAGGISKIRTDFALSNQLRSSALLAALDAGTLNPFISSNDPAALTAVRTNALERYEGRTAFVQAKASSELARLANGPLALAIGIERRRESFATELDPLRLAGDLAGSGGGTFDASAARSVSASFVEVNWPAALGVEVQLAARRDDYSDFGSSISPKIAARWQPVKSVLLRASAGRGFLPPSLQQLNRPQTEFNDSFADPIRCPVTQSPDDCGVPRPHTQQGNPALKAERSRQVNLGIVLEPIAGLTASIDAWRIAHRNKIAFGDRYFLANESAFPDRIVRAPPSAADIALGLPGPIVELRDTYVNLASREVRGTDIELKGRFAPQPWGSVTVSALLSHAERFVEQFTPQAAADDKAGFDGRPHWRAQLGAAWQSGPWQAGVNVKFIGRYRYTADDDTVRTVASWTVFDLSAGWRGPRDELLLGVQNAGDRAPPMRDSFDGYDSAMHDPIGRLVSVTWRHSF